MSSYGNLAIGAMQKIVSSDSDGSEPQAKLNSVQQGWLCAFAKTTLKTASALTSKRR